MTNRMFQRCNAARHVVQELWYALQQHVTDTISRTRMPEPVQRIAEVMRTTGSRKINSVRKTIDRVTRRVLGRETSQALLSQNTANASHQPLQPIQLHHNFFLQKCTTSTARAATTSKFCTEDDKNKVAGGRLTIPKPPLSVTELEHYLTRAIHSTELNDQLMNVPLEDETRAKVVARQPNNVKKNRYKNNIPYDDTRVLLADRGCADYINASHITYPEGSHRFIAAQGPKGINDYTVDDFWLMVWQNNTNVIIMLANLTEGGREKVALYWPNTEGQTEVYGEVKVLTKSEKIHSNYTTRLFLLSVDKDSRLVVQYQYTTWPDHSVPYSPAAAADMIRNIYGYHWTGPPVVHCSAGLGRTGTILLVLMLLDWLSTKGHFHPPEALRRLRMCRPNLLDNRFQYRFAHCVLLELLFGHMTSIPLTKAADKEYQTALNKSLHDQFQKLKSFPTGATYDWARAHDPLLNRNNSVLPVDGRHVSVAAPRDGSGTQYVNAVRVKGVGLQDAFIVTENPTNHTVGRTMRLAFMVKASSWVFLHDHRGFQEQEHFPSVLPIGGEGMLEGISVKVQGEIQQRFHTETFITLSQGQGLTHTMCVIQFKDWHPSRELPDHTDSLTALVDRLLQLRQAAAGRIIMVSCSDGYSASGVLVTLARLLEEVRLTQRFDLYRTALSVQFDRPQFIKSLRQYYSLKEYVLLYVQRSLGNGGERRQNPANNLEGRDGHDTRMSYRKSDNGSPSQSRISMKNNIRDNNEGRQERTGMQSHILKRSRGAIRGAEWELEDVGKSIKERQQYGAGETTSRHRENEKEHDNEHIFEARGGNRKKQNVMRRRSEGGSDAKRDFHYANVNPGEFLNKKSNYENIWETQMGKRA